MPGLRIRRVNGKRTQFSEYVGRPAVATVAEGAAKPATGAEYAQVTLDIVKGAAVVLYTQELIEDAQEDPTVLVNNDVRAAFADWVDSNSLGMANGSAIVGSFNSELTSTSSTVELGTTGDAIAKAVSAAMAVVEGNGYNPSGVILGGDGRAALRDARAAVETTTPVYSDGFTQPQDGLYGLPIRYSTNLDNLGATAGAGQIVGVVGDFSQALLAIRKDITVDFTNQATVDVGGTLHHLWQQNKVASLWEARMGFVAHDLNRSFCAIVNAS